MYGSAELLQIQYHNLELIMLVNSDINIKKVGFQFVLISVDFCIFF